MDPRLEAPATRAPSEKYLSPLDFAGISTSFAPAFSFPMLRTFSPSIEALEARIAPAALASIPLAGLHGVDGFMLSGINYGDNAGSSVADAGDVNGDGLADVLVGAPGANEGGIYRGAAYVVFGQAGGFGAGVDLAKLDGQTGFKISGVTNYNRVGQAVSAAGDINGDGFDDVLIGASSPSAVGDARGTAYVVFGKAGGFAASVAVSALDGSNGFKFTGVTENGHSPISVSGAGDMNGDGYAEMIIGGALADADGLVRGAACVVFGKAGGFGTSVALVALDGSDGFRLTGLPTHDGFGISVSDAGDVDADGFGDVIVGDSAADEAGENNGAAYVVFGKAGGFAASMAVSALDGGNGFKLIGAADGDLAGSSVSAAGDVNGDGIADLLIGAYLADAGGYNRGAAYVVFGSDDGFGASIELSALDGSNGFKLSGVNDSDFAGGSVSAAGDFNADGFGDLLIGADAANEGGSDRGAAYVVFGKADGFGASIALSALDGKNGFKLSGVANGDFVGGSVSAAGDVNGDGYADLLIGADREGAGDRGAAYVVFGRPEVRVTLSAGGKTATFPDIDGDLVTVKVTKGALSQRDFTFSDGVWQKLDLSGNPLLFGGTNLTVTVKKALAGDGRVNLGAIDAHGLDLGSVTLPGDLGQIDAGDTIFKTPAIKSLTVGSLGVDSGTQPAATLRPLQSDIVGTLARLTVKGSVEGVVSITGGSGAHLGPVNIGSLDGSAGGTHAGLLRAVGNIGPVVVQGSVRGGADFSGIIAGGKLGLVTIGGVLTSIDAQKPVIISALGDLNATTAAQAVAIAGINVKSNINNARILAGYNVSLGAQNPDAGIGPVTIMGFWRSSSIVAGVVDSTGDGFGRNDTLISGHATTALVSTIASITIKGTATGSIGTGGTDHFGISAQRVGKLTIGTTKHMLSLGVANNILLDPNNIDFRLIDFA